MRKYAFILALAILLAFSQAPATEFQVEIENFDYVPSGMHIVAGDMITWINRDPISHTSTSDNGVWDSGILLTGQSFSFTFSNTGSFPYHCAIHPFMQDTIFVAPQTGIDDPSASAPGEFELSQNYPNPFNGRTLIKYALPQNGHVKVEVYDLLGRIVATLVDGDQSAGSYAVPWDAPFQSSGVFFYRVSVDNLTKSGRMVLLK